MTCIARPSREKTKRMANAIRSSVSAAPADTASSSAPARSESQRRCSSRPSSPIRSCDWVPEFPQYAGKVNADPGLTLTQALRGITINAAHQMPQDAVTGSLERGADDISGTEVLMTDGRREGGVQALAARGRRISHDSQIPTANSGMPIAIRATPSAVRALAR